MSVTSELTAKHIGEFGFLWKEKAADKWFEMCRRVGEVIEMPRLTNLAFNEVDIQSGVLIPLKGNREMRLWIKKTSGMGWLQKRTCVVTKFVVDNSQGEMCEDVILQDVNDKMFRIDNYTHKPDGLKFIARFDPVRDIDEGKLDGGELQQKVIVALRGNII